MLSDEVSPMIQLIRKISAIILAGLLGLNLAVAAAVVVAPCPSSMCSSGPMDMHHCDGLLDFAFPLQGCCGECNDIFCDLMKNPWQDVNAVDSSPFQGRYHHPFLGNVDPIGEGSLPMALSEARYLLPAAPTWSQVPLYIEHLSLII